VKAALQDGTSQRGQGHYIGRSPKAPAWPEVLEKPQYEQHHHDYHHHDYHGADHPSPPPPDGFPRQAW
jgi:hypothetical protein